MKKLFNPWLLVFACVSLGLAPFYPEPHLWGKLKWIEGGAQGMQPLDWFDVAVHGLPWLLLIGYGIGRLTARYKK